MIHRGQLFIPVVVLAALCLSSMRAAGPGVVQVVYESDTRGYYLPCG